MTDNALTPERRKLFEDYGLDLVKQDLGRGGIQYLGTSDARRAAILWVKEQEEKQNQLEQQRHTENINIGLQSATFAKRAYWIAIASLIVAVIALLK